MNAGDGFANVLRARESSSSLECCGKFAVGLTLSPLPVFPTSTAVVSFLYDTYKDPSTRTAEHTGSSTYWFMS